jgi:hypothetical protein
MRGTMNCGRWRVALGLGVLAMTWIACAPTSVVSDVAPAPCASQARGYCGAGMYCDQGERWSRCSPVPTNPEDCGWERWRGECSAKGVGGTGGASAGQGGAGLQWPSGGFSGSAGGYSGGGGAGPDYPPAQVDAADLGGAGDSGLLPPVPEAGAEDVSSVDTGPLRPTCVAECTPGDKRCEAGVVEACTMQPSGCAAWGPLSTCPMPQTCPAGKSGCECPKDEDSCSKAKETRCTADGIETCEKSGACLAWSKPKACAAPQTCVGSKGCECPKSACTNNGEQRCGGDGVETCVKDGACLVWKTTKTCAAPQTCTSSGRGAAPDCVCGSGSVSCQSGCRPITGACVAIWFATPDGNGPPADCIHRSEGLCRENDCELSIQKKRYILPSDNIDVLLGNCQTGGHFDELFAAVCAELRARNVGHGLVDFYADVYDGAGAWKDNRWITNKRCP